jgi:hypothetical protein
MINGFQASLFTFKLRRYTEDFCASGFRVGVLRTRNKAGGDYAGFQGTSNGGQHSSNWKTRVNRRSDLPYNGTTWRFDRLLFRNWRPPSEVPWKHAKGGAQTSLCVSMSIHPDGESCGHIQCRFECRVRHPQTLNTNPKPQTLNPQ